MLVIGFSNCLFNIIILMIIAKLSVIVDMDKINYVAKMTIILQKYFSNVHDFQLF